MVRKNHCKIHTVPLEKEVTRINKNGEEVITNISYILQFIYSARFIGSSLLNLVNNLSEEIHEIKSKYRHDDKKCETCKITYKLWDCFLEYMNFKDDLNNTNIYVVIIINKSLMKS